MKNIGWVMAFFLMLTALSHAHAQEDFFPQLKAEEVKKMLDSEKKMLLVDARTDQEYAEGHIPSAISISPEKLSIIGVLLPHDKSIPIVFYCRGHG